MVKTLILAAILVGLNSPALAYCRQALALGLDVSSSVDEGEYAAQIDGLSQALNDSKVRHALQDTSSGHVAIMVYEWSGRQHQVVIQPWVEITENHRVDHVIATLNRHNRSDEGKLTALGYAMAFGRDQLENSPACLRKTLDISGDGIANEGYRPSRAIRRYDFTNIVVNALVVGDPAMPAIPNYYRQEVIFGFGAFVEQANGYDDYARAMKLKLLRELSTLAVSELED